MRCHIVYLRERFHTVSDTNHGSLNLTYLFLKNKHDFCILQSKAQLLKRINFPVKDLGKNNFPKESVWKYLLSQRKLLKRIAFLKKVLGKNNFPKESC